MIGPVRLRIPPTALESQEVLNPKPLGFPPHDLGKRRTEETRLARNAVQPIPAIIGHASPKPVKVKVLKGKEEPLGERLEA